MPLYAYADETVFKIDPDKCAETVGCGIFITTEEISSELIFDAIQQLKHAIANDEIAINRNKKILNRSHFHAADDTREAKECLCAAIKNNINGVFIVSYFDNVGETAIKKTEAENFFTRCLTRSTLALFRSTEKVHLCFEGRGGLSSAKMEKWKEYIYRLFEDTSIPLPSYKTFFPEIEISFGNKKTPGLQVVDFMLWTLNRSKRIITETHFLDKLRFYFYHHAREEGSNHNSGSYYLGKYPVELNSEYPVPYKKPDTYAQFLNGYLLIERILRRLDETDFDNSTIHLLKPLKAVHEILFRPQHFFKEEELIQIGRTYIRLYDSLPVYKFISDEETESWMMLHASKHIASLLINTSTIEVVWAKDEINWWRFNIQKTKKWEALMIDDRYYS